MNLCNLFLFIYLFECTIAQCYGPEVKNSLDLDTKTVDELNLSPVHNSNKKRYLKPRLKRQVHLGKGVHSKETLVNNIESSDDFKNFDNLFQDTDELMIKLKLEGHMLARDTKDNDNVQKYAHSLLENFYLKFIKEYVSVDPNVLVPNLYEMAYRTALADMKSHRDSDALQLAAPVVKVSVILKAVIDPLVEIVQTSCNKTDQPCQCGDRYYIMLDKAKLRCPNIWFNHHKIFVETLKLMDKRPLLDVTKNIVASVDFMTSHTQDDSDDEDYLDDIDIRHILFDSTMKLLNLFKQVLKKYLITRASVYKLVAKYQNEDKLDCVMI